MRIRLDFQSDNQTNSCYCVSEMLVVCVVLIAENKHCSDFKRIALNGIQCKTMNAFQVLASARVNIVNELC